MRYRFWRKRSLEVGYSLLAEALRLRGSESSGVQQEGFETNLNAR